MNSSQNEGALGDEGVLENEQGQARGEGGGKNSGILSKRTF